MKITTILGSPKKRGNTAAALEMFEQIISREHEVSRFNMVDVEIKGCKGCNACKKNLDQPGCVQRDDAEIILRSIMDADAVVYASPLYCWSFPSELKALIDRHYCLVKGYGTDDYKSLIADKRAALLVTCAGPIENNADLIQKMFDRMGSYVQFDIAGKYILPMCTTPEAFSREARETVKQMAMDVAGP